MEKLTLTLVETISVKDGIIANPSTPFDISMEKGIDSAVGTLAHMIHQLGIDFNKSRSKGASVTYTLQVDGVDTAIVFGTNLGLVIKEKASEAYLKEGGLKKLTLKDFTLDFTAFRIALPAIRNVIKYHLGAYLDSETRAAAYKETVKKYFDKDIKEGKSDLTSWSVQTKAAIETSLYVVRDLMEAAQQENTSEYLEMNRESSRRAIEFKKEQRALKSSK
jgi:hypothetical protein